MAVEVGVGEGDAEFGELQAVDGAALGLAQLGIFGAGAGAAARQQDLRQVGELVMGGDAQKARQAASRPIRRAPCQHTFTQ